MSLILPENIRTWFHDRGINDQTLSEFNIGWTGTHIKIPIYDTYKLRRSPFSEEGPKYLNPKGCSTVLFKTHQVLSKEAPVIIAEGELDVLRLHSAGYQAVCSTGGAGTFRREWSSELQGCKDIFICYDYDPAGISGSFNTHEMIPGSRIVWLPKYVGEHGDITDFFRSTEYPEMAFDLLCTPSISYKLPSHFDDGSSKSKRIKSITEYIYELMEVARKVRCEFGRNSRSDAPEQYLISLLNGELGHLRRKPTPRDNYSEETLTNAKTVPISNFLDFSHGNSIPCIFHDEKTGSLHYYPKNNKVYCFGCKKSADVIDVIQKLRECTLSEAIKIALGRTN